MCGLTGFLDASGEMRVDDLRTAGVAMSDAIHHRGPDDEGIWTDPAAGICMGFRRLAIVDLSPMGHQPMESRCGRYVLLMNGEIYNYEAIRTELENLGEERAPVFRGRSDTEVLLASIVQWGLEPAIQRAAGMFAIALWDRQERTLSLGRDRLGEKPLYYGWAGQSFVFASELKAIRAYPKFEGRIDRGALTLFLRQGYIPDPYAVYDGIRKLTPGTIVTVTLADVRTRSWPSPQPYWSLDDVAAAGVICPFEGGTDDAIEHLDRLLRAAVGQQMVADVPLGALLSGGIDSSTVVALMQAQSPRPVKTFTIGFHETGYSEAGYAREVARHLGTDHTELYVTPREAMDIIPALPRAYDEPFADPSQIPTMLVSRLARRHVTVSLAGDGGDELLGGYNRHVRAQSMSRSLGRIPALLRRSLAKGVAAVPSTWWDRGASVVWPFLPGRFRHSNPGDKVAKLTGILNVALDHPERLYRMLTTHWDDPACIVLGACEPETVITNPAGWPELADFTHTMMYLDTLTYLPGGILAKVDRASMDVSLEVRAPFLDHRVVEFAWSLPLEMKIREGQGKWLLRQMLYDYVPRELIERPKMGFGVPIDQWLRGPLRAWAEDLLDETRLRQDGFLRPEPVREKWEAHVSGKANWQNQVWDVLMLQAWLDSL